MLLSIFKRFKSIKKQIAELMSKRQPIVLNERDLMESFVKGSGPGGQAVNKTNNAVWLTHLPSGIKVKFAVKSLERNAKRCEKDEAAEKVKLKKAIEKQNFEGAKIYAESAIRKKNEALNYRRLAARIDGVASQVQTAVTMRTVSKSMGGVVDGLSRALEANQLEKVSMIMDQFEAQTENMAVQSAYMEAAMRNTTALTTPEDQVVNLMQQVADEHGLELKNQLGSLSLATAASALESPGREADDPLSERLAKLRNS